MDWQTWLVPSFVGIILGLIVSLITSHLTRRHSEKMFRLQRDAQDQDERRARGLKLAEQALVQLNILRANLPLTIWGQHNEEAWQACDGALEELRHATVVLPDAALRARLVLVSDVLTWPDEISQWGKPSFSPRDVVSIGISEGVGAVGAYIRGEELPELSESLRNLHAAHGVTMEELEWQREEQKRMEQEERAQRRSTKGSAQQSSD